MKKEIEKIVDKYLPKKYNFNVYVNEQERKELFEDIEKLLEWNRLNVMNVDAKKLLKH